MSLKCGLLRRAPLKPPRCANNNMGAVFLTKTDLWAKWHAAAQALAPLYYLGSAATRISFDTWSAKLHVSDT